MSTCGDGTSDSIGGSLIAAIAVQPSPVRSSLQTSLNLVLLGIAVISFNLGAGWFVEQSAALIAEGTAIVAGTAYILGSATQYGFPVHTPSTPMAAQTAVSVFLLVPALLGGRPNQGIMTLVTSQTRSGRMTRQILLACQVAPPFIGAAIRLGVVAGLTT